MNSARWKAIVLSFRAFERTKLYDFLAALPLVVWYVSRLWERWPELAGTLIAAQVAPDPIGVLRALAEIGTFGFVLFVIVMLIVRVPPKAKAQGILPRVAGLIGTFATLLYLQLEPADLSLPMQTLAVVLVVGGCFFGIFVVIALGRSFSIMAEARQLKTGGPYALVRHPLYLAEELIVIGAAIQYQQPWGALLAIVHFGCQIWRMHNEERVLAAAFPQYAAYAARTSRLIPGIY